jgi:hypothetical protein
MWTCPKCRQRVDDAFEVCWSCGTTADGIEDPDFETADEAEPIADEPLPEPVALDDPLADLAGDAPPDLVECYMAESPIEAKFVADQLMERGIPAIADRMDINMTLGGGETMPGKRSRSLVVKNLFLLVGCLWLIWPSNASANPIVPPIAIVWPVAWFALIPVILVEAAVACQVLGWGFGRSLRMASAANLISTLVGVPIGSFLIPLPFLIFIRRWWFLPAMLLSLYGLSVFIEVLVADKFTELYVSRRPVWRWALISNAISYLLILAALAAYAKSQM